MRLLVFSVFVIALGCNTSQEKCTCVRSILYYNINRSIITGSNNPNLKKCSAFIKKSATLSFFAAEYFYKLQEEDFAIEYLKKSVSNGVNYEILEDYTFVRSLYAGQRGLKNELYDLWQKHGLKHFNSDLYLLIDSLYTFDQEVRSQGYTNIENEKFIDIKEVDKYVVDRLKHDVLLRHNISEKRISVLGAYKLYIILLHNLTHIDQMEFDKYEGVLKKATYNGQLNSIYYASIIDRRKILFDDADPIFYEYNIDNKIPENMGLVDSLRFQIGLSPLTTDTKWIKKLFNDPCCP